MPDRHPETELRVQALGAAIVELCLGSHEDDGVMLFALLLAASSLLNRQELPLRAKTYLEALGVFGRSVNIDRNTLQHALLKAYPTLIEAWEPDGHA